MLLSCANVMPKFSRGIRSLSTVDIYDTITGRWASSNTGAGSLSVARNGAVAAAAGDKIVIAGGADTPTATVDIYDVLTGQWTTGILSIARSDLAVAAAGTKIVFAGGSSVPPPLQLEAPDLAQQWHQSCRHG